MASIAALALLVAAGFLATGATAAKTTVRPAQQIASFESRGSNGWKLQVTALTTDEKKIHQPIGIFTHGPRGGEVQYLGVLGSASVDGAITASVPGIGRVGVHFEQTKETTVIFHPQPGCKSEGRSATLKGYFRGTIEFHGERGYTMVNARSARGEIELIPTEVCRRPKHHPRHPGATADEAGVEFLSAVRNFGAGALEFEAVATGLRAPETGEPVTEFSASYIHQRGKLTIIASTRILGEEKGLLSLTAPNGRPTEATVEPPLPFTGVGHFELESPTTASWTGDLGVEVPTLGTESLTEPTFLVGACAAHCTKTFPEGTGFVTASRLP